MPKILTFPELKPKGIHHTRRHVDRLEATGQFPRRVPLSANRVGWVEAEIDAHIEAKIASRSTRLGALGSQTEV